MGDSHGPCIRTPPSLRSSAQQGEKWPLKSRLYHGLAAIPIHWTNNGLYGAPGNGQVPGSQVSKAVSLQLQGLMGFVKVTVTCAGVITGCETQRKGTALDVRGRREQQGIPENEPSKLRPTG